VRAAAVGQILVSNAVHWRLEVSGRESMRRRVPAACIEDAAVDIVGRRICRCAVALESADPETFTGCGR
jgi:hypothetical protein